MECPREDGEHDEIGDDEEQEHDDEQLHAADATGELAVDLNEAGHDHGLPGARVELHFGATLKEDQRLAMNRLEQVVRRQEEECSERHDGDRDRLLGVHLRERAKKERERAAKRRRPHGQIRGANEEDRDTGPLRKVGMVRRTFMPATSPASSAARTKPR